jgi:steroid delta-isomerase-like uncharacterized protein
MAETVQQRCDDWLAAWNRKDLDTYLTYYSDDIELYGYAPTVMRRAEVRDYYETFLNAFDVHSTADEMLWDGERVAIRFTVNATQIAPFDGIEPSGRTVSWPCLSILHWQDGRIVRRYSLQDMEAVHAALAER